MSSFVDELWECYAEESVEQLDAIEFGLGGVSPEQVGLDRVNSVLRAFHNLKGASRALDMVSIEAIAHLSEDILGLLRSHEAAPTAELVHVLLAAAQFLRGRVESAVETRISPSQDETLLESLRQAAEGLEEKLGPLATEQANIHVPETTHAPGWCVFEDRDILRFFAELMAEDFPSVCLGLCRVENLTDVEHGELQSKLGILVHASTQLEFHHMVQLAEILVAETAKDSPDTQALLAALGLYAQDLRHIEGLEGFDCGINEAREKCVPYLSVSLRKEIQRATAMLSSAEFSQFGKDVDREPWAQLETVVSNMIPMTFLTQPDPFTEAILVAEQVIRECARGTQPVGRELNEQFSGFFAVIDSCLGQACDEVADVLAQCVAQLLEAAADTRMRTISSRADDPEGFETAAEMFELGNLELSDRLRERIELPSRLFSLLDPGDLMGVYNALENNLNVYVLSFDMEGASSTGQTDFIDWLAEDCMVFTNRSSQSVVPDLRPDDPPRYYVDFLIASYLRADEIGVRVCSFGESDALYRLEECLRLEPSAEGLAQPEESNAAEPLVEESGRPERRTETIRVRSQSIDRFVEQVGQLVLLRNMLGHTMQNDNLHGKVREARRFLDTQPNGAATDVLEGLLGSIQETFREFTQIDLRMTETLSAVQQSVLSLRVVPISRVFQRLPSMVRQAAFSQGKRVQVLMHGLDVAIDKHLVDQLLEPLMHMVRNSVDHGIEAPEERLNVQKQELALIELRALQRVGGVVVEVSDDGRGIDLIRVQEKAIRVGILSSKSTYSEEEILECIFHPGFSTTDEITELSGRGVGMDVVRTQIVALGGDVSVETFRGHGTTFRLSLPLSVAIQSVLIVRVGDELLGVPDRSIIECASLSPEDVSYNQGRPGIMNHGTYLPLFDLAELLGFEPDSTTAAGESILIVANGNRKIALRQDGIEGRKELYIKDLDPRLKPISILAGSSVLGDARLVLILDISRLVDLAWKRVVQEPRGLLLQ